MIHNYAYEKTSNPPLNLIGCIGLEQFLSQIMKQFPDISFPINSMNIREVANDKFNLGDVRVCTTLSDHTERSISFRFDFNDKSLVYTSDCVYSARLEKLCNKADILISECSFPDEWPTNDHMNAQKLGVMAENAQVKKLFVTHRYPPASDVNLEAQIKKYYSGPIRIAQDGDYIKLK
jgi:ribonuclease BN (tRNA processing enzyme)